MLGGFRKTLWAPVPSLPTIPRPLDVLLIEKTVTERGKNLVLRLAINNGTDKMQYHVGLLWTGMRWSLRLIG